MDPIEASEVVPGLRFRPENEVKLNYSARITGAEWERHAEAVKHMHEQRRTRREILETLHNDHEFCPSMAQLNMHMKKRKLRVYANGKDETVEVTEAEVSPASEVVAGVDESSASISSPARQNNDTFELQHMGNLERDLTTRDAVPLELPGDDQDREPRFRERLSQAMVTTPADDLSELSSLNLDFPMFDGVETSIKPTSLTPDMVSMQHSRQSELNVEEPAEYIPESTGDRNIVRSDAVRDIEKAMVQVDQDHSVDSNQYTASPAASNCSLMSHQSDGSSLRAFRHFAAEVARDRQLRRKDSHDSLCALTIMSEDSWDFGLVTGIPSGYPSPSGTSLPTRADWKAYRLIITDLYQSQNLRLSDLVKYMQDYYGFIAT